MLDDSRHLETENSGIPRVHQLSHFQVVLEALMNFQPTFLFWLAAPADFLNKVWLHTAVTSAMEATEIFIQNFARRWPCSSSLRLRISVSTDLASTSQSGLQEFRVLTPVDEKKRFGIETLHREIYNNRFQSVVTRTNGFAMFFQEAVSASHFGRLPFGAWIFCRAGCSNKKTAKP